MTSYYFWYAIALALVVGELATGTLWLIALAVGFLCGGLIEQFVGDWQWAVFVCAAAAMLCGLAVRRYRLHQHAAPIMDNDIGQTVTFVALGDGPSRVRVAYRGSTWDAKIVAGNEMPAEQAPGRIEGRQSNLLLVSF